MIALICINQSNHAGICGEEGIGNILHRDYRGIMLPYSLLSTSKTSSAMVDENRRSNDARQNIRQGEIYVPCWLRRSGPPASHALSLLANI